MEEPTDNTLALDTTEEYLQIGRRKTTVIKQEPNEREEAKKKLFLENAFLFFDNRERILDDSKMYFASVPIQSGLAYTGTSGFRNPTLGIYLEFWMSCPQAAWIDGNGRKYLVYRIAGSPLSGSNRCGIVYEDGTTKDVQLPDFRDLWRSFIDINKSHDAEKLTSESYSLQMVVGLLKGFYRLSNEAFFYKRMAEYWAQRCKAAESAYKDMSRKILHTKMNAVRQQLKVLVDDVDRQQLKIDSMAEETRRVRREILNKLHAKGMTPAEYQRWWMALPIRKKKNETIEIQNRMIHDTLKGLFPEDFYAMSLNTVRQFLEESKQVE